MSSSETLTVAQAGASGLVNTMFRHYLLDPRLRMELGDVAASREEHVGKTLGEVDENCPPQWAEKQLIRLTELAQSDAPVIFSGLRADAAAEHEDQLAQGRLVVTNASANRMNPDVPLLNPYFNGSHLDELFNLDLTDRIIAGGNCGVNIGSVLMAPIKHELGIETMHIETLQGWSGDGKLAIPEGKEGRIFDIRGDEKEKIETEPNKFLGKSMHEPAGIEITADPKRAPWVRGHHLKITATLAQKTSVSELQHLLRGSHAPPELDEIKKELQALGQMKRKRWPRRYEQWPGNHQPIKPVKLAYESPVRWDSQPIKLGDVYPMRVIGYVKEVDEADPREAILEAAGDNLVLGAVGNNLLNIMYARLKGYI
jgi:aspartate-semialdehyde dehydrogenase